ncbi:MAG: DUF3137 domain-containing protein [Bacteroidota bacterium]
MRRIADFRLFYNHTIHPELVRMERIRKRLLVLLVVSVTLIATLIIVLLFFQAALFAFFLVLPFGFYISFLLYRIQQFRLTFKPNVMNLILDFVDDSVNYGTLKYDGKRKIEQRRFHASQIFKTPAHQYKGEDYISGKIGELDFELSELNVREYSKVRSRLNYVFRGIFLYANLNREMEGEILILPKEFKQYLSKTIRSFNLKGGQKLEEETLSPEFEHHFLAYATADADTNNILSSDMQHTIAEFRSEKEKEIYVSFIKNEIYIAITEPKDILEPYIFRSNVSFELISEFFEEINLLLSIVDDFDKSH